MARRALLAIISCARMAMPRRTCVPLPSLLPPLALCDHTDHATGSGQCCASLASHLPLLIFSQTLAHKLPLRETQPPFTRHLAPTLKQPRVQPARQLLPHLPHIPSQRLRLIPVPGPLKRLVERKARLAW
jgi:hypothetical protein